MHSIRRVIRAPSAPGEMFSWIRKHEPIHGVRLGETTSACGLVHRWIEQTDYLRVSCQPCRRALGLAPWRPVKGDPEWGLFIDYG